MILLLLLTGSIFLTGCSGGRNPEPEWSFQEEPEEGGDSAGENAGEAPDPLLEAEAGTAEGTAPGDAGVLAETAEGTAPEEAGALTEAAEPGYVYVCGAVVHPGVYEIEEGTRVFEVIAQAGGLTEQADAEWLNQAAAVLDGQKIQIYTKEETAAFREAGLPAPGEAGAQQEAGAQAAAGDTAGAAAQGAAGEERVNINTADRDLLMTLPGIGESKAEAILQYRQEHGNFGSIRDICRVSGIKEAVFSRIEDRITV